MPSSSKRKGNGYERELVNLAVARGMDARRAYASNGESLGHHAEVDCLIEGKRVQAKRRKMLASFLRPTEHVDAVVFREDRGESFVLLRLEDWLELLEAKANEDGKWQG